MCIYVCYTRARTPMCIYVHTYTHRERYIYIREYINMFVSEDVRVFACVH